MKPPPRILVLGATSAIAQAYSRLRAQEQAVFHLVGRHEERLRSIAADLVARGAQSADVSVVDLAVIEGIEASAQALRDRFGDPDELFLSYGELGDAIHDWNFAVARKLLDTNFTSAVLWILGFLDRRPRTIPFTIVGISSVAGDHGRAANLIYGAAKAGLDLFLEGLAQKYHGSPIRVLRVKPGFVDTPMTAHIKKGGLLWATPERVASDIHHAVVKRRAVIYTPWFWWPIMMIIRHLPRPVFHRLRI